VSHGQSESCCERTGTQSGLLCTRCAHGNKSRFFLHTRPSQYCTREREQSNHLLRGGETRAICL
jgi:hypothetical protein